MKIISLIENTSQNGLPTEHGLSLYIETDDRQKLLFDMGQSALFARNAESLGISIADIDFAIVSHGHYDHGGGLSTFLTKNQQAKVFMHKDAFLPHYSLRDSGFCYIGLDVSLKDHARIVSCDKQTVIGKGLILFANVCGTCCNPVGNRLLFGPSKEKNDTFSHEQNLVIAENNKLLLFAGCAHSGIVNIIHRAQDLLGKAPTHVFAGMHLVKSGLTDDEENRFICELASELQKYKTTKFYTMHCTGEVQYKKLRALMGDQIQYMSCGETICL